jgi:class 3 adenylate cyclase
LGRAIPKADLLRLAGSQDEGSSSQSKQRLALAILLPVLAALVLGAASCVCASQLRWLLRSLSMQRKRAMGLPSKGSITVAVTDIQGYTKLSEAHPQAMGQVRACSVLSQTPAAVSWHGAVIAAAAVVSFC